MDRLGAAQSARHPLRLSRRNGDGADHRRPARRRGRPSPAGRRPAQTRGARGVLTGRYSCGFPVRARGPVRAGCERDPEPASVKLLAASLVLLSAAMAFAPAVAHADTVTDKKAEYAAARARVARLDHRVERLTERYNALSWRLDVLDGRIRIAVRRLRAERLKLAHDVRVLAELLVDAYKTQSPTDAAILLGAGDLGE